MWAEPRRSWRWSGARARTRCWRKRTRWWCGACSGPSGRWAGRRPRWRIPVASPDRNRVMKTEVGRVTRVERTRPGAQELRVLVGEREERALNYSQLLGEVGVNEVVLLNTTAVRQGLGTGGYHFVMKRAGEQPRPEGAGHIVKLRYTPLQFQCLSVEEQDSPYRDAIEACEDLDEMPVIVAGLHSQVPPAAAAVKAL